MAELSRPEPAKKKRFRVSNIILNIVAVISVSFAAFLVTNTIVLKTTYNLPYFVNGMSMFPTLNANCKSSTGKMLTFHDGVEHVPGYEAEFGYGKTGDQGNWRNDLHRYDIVVTYYPDDCVKKADGSYQRDSQGNLVFIENKRSKIKRIIGMPGETIRLEGCSEDDPNGMYNRIWGKTTITHVDGTSEVLKPVYTPDDYPSYDGAPYAYPTYVCAYQEVTLKENEYYVMGDNRGYSSDSRTKGPVTTEMITGKAYLVMGKDVVRNLDDASLPVWHVLVPWNYRRIG